MTVTAPEDKKLMAPRRINAILDPGSVKYVANQTEGIGAVSATGTINGREVVVFSNDPSFQGGSLGAVEGNVITAAKKWQWKNNVRLLVFGIQVVRGYKKEFHH